MNARSARAFGSVGVGRVESRRERASEGGGGATREISVRGVAEGEFRRGRARRGDSCRGFGIVRWETSVCVDVERERGRECGGGGVRTRCRATGTDLRATRRRRDRTGSREAYRA